MDIISIIGVILITVFAYSGVSKLLSLNVFRRTLDDLGFSKLLSVLLSVLVPIAEIFSSLLLIFPVTRILGQILIYLLLFGFLYAVWKSLAVPSNIACQCFGNLLQESIGMKTFYRIIILFMFNTLIFAYQHESYHASELIEWIFAFLFSISILILYSLLSTIKDYNRIVQKSKN